MEASVLFLHLVFYFCYREVYRQLILGFAVLYVSRSVYAAVNRQTSQEGGLSDIIKTPCRGILDPISYHLLFIQIDHLLL